MAFTLKAAALNITQRLANEHALETGTRPQITWTGQHELRDNLLWIEVEIIEPTFHTSVKGWTSGQQQHGAIAFIPND